MAKGGEGAEEVYRRDEDNRFSFNLGGAKASRKESSLMNFSKRYLSSLPYLTSFIPLETSSPCNYSTE